MKYESDKLKKVSILNDENLFRWIMLKAKVDKYS